MVSDRAAHLRDAYLRMRLERYDLQVHVQKLEHHTAEEVYVYSNEHEEAIRLAPLEKRAKELQLNMKARGESGNNLVLMSRAELESIYSELFEDAIRYLNKRHDLPPVLQALTRAPDWREQTFGEPWVSRIKADQRAARDVVGYFQGLVDDFPDPPGPMQMATAIFAEFLLGRIFGYYRPWVYLDHPAEPKEGTALEDKVLLKYLVDGANEVTIGERVRLGLFGVMNVEVARPLAENASSHFRVRPPKGMVFQYPKVEGPAPGITNYALDPEQAQIYVSADQAAATFEETGRPPAAVLRARATQTTSMRMLVALLFLVGAVLPAFLVLDHLTGIFSWSAFRDNVATLGPLHILPLLWGDLAVAIDATEASEVMATFQLSLPLAFGLVASTWDRPAVRAYAVTQLVLASALTVFWVAGLAFPPVAVLALVGGVLLMGYNLREAYHLLKAPYPRSP